MAIQARNVSYQSGKHFLSAYLAQPDGASQAPGLVVIHEVFGLNDNIRDVCRRFAGEGYAALGVDLFAGRNRAVCLFRFMAATLTGSLNHQGINDLKAGLGWLGQQPGVDPARVGAIGFCMGGGFAITWACTDRRLKVIAPFYGMAPRSGEALKRLCPVVGSYPEKDFTTGAAHRIDAVLDTTRTPHDIKVYPGAQHAFFNDQRPAYNSEAAADAWRRTLAFFTEHLAQLPPVQEETSPL
jgi:carboxymethylenebutenolidase